MVIVRCSQATPGIDELNSRAPGNHFKFVYRTVKKGYIGPMTFIILLRRMQVKNNCKRSAILEEGTTPDEDNC